MLSDARALAARLGAADDADLAALFARRGVSPTAPWRTLYDAADALLAEPSVDRAVLTSSRAELQALQAAAAASAPVEPALRAGLDARALLTADGIPLRAVARAVTHQASARPQAFVAAAAAPVTSSDAAGAASAAESAWESTASLAEIVLAGIASPPARTGAGGVTAADRRRFVEAGTVDSAEELEDLLDSGRRAGLLWPADREWLVTDAGEQWLGTSTLERWTTVVLGLRESLPAVLRTPAGGWIPHTAWADAVPLDPEWPATAAQLRRLFRMWGLLDTADAEPGWTTTLRAGLTPDADALAAYVPPEIDRIYLQADLTAIAPGMLAPALDMRLRTMAVRESFAQASTYRFTDESLTAAVADGETADSIREFLSSLSLTGIPQPLDYLIDRAASRYGLIRVGSDPQTGRARVFSVDESLLDTVVVDQSLRAIGLVRDAVGLTSRLDRDTVYWSLADARYPVVAVDAAGAPVPLRRRRTAAPPATDAASRYAALIATLRENLEGDSDAAWLGRELDAAVRARATIDIVVALPGGDTREFRIEATGLGGGRLRGRDRTADTERTVPVSSILSVRSA